jgi:hypothetical protein
LLPLSPCHYDFFLRHFCRLSLFHRYARRCASAYAAAPAASAVGSSVAPFYADATCCLRQLFRRLIIIAMFCRFHAIAAASPLPLPPFSFTPEMIIFIISIFIAVATPARAASAHIDMARYCC